MKSPSIRKMLRYLVFSLLILISTFLTGELFLRLIVGPPASFIYSDAARDVQTDFDITYGVNDRKMRKTCSVPGEKSRIAVIGDSFVFGQGVYDCKEFSSLANKFSGKLFFDNFGVIGIDINDYGMIARDYVDSKYDAVFVVFYGNDAYALSKPRHFWGEAADNSSILSLARKIKHAFIISDLLREIDRGKVFNNIEALISMDKDYIYRTVETDDADLAVFKEKFSALITNLRMHDIKKIYVTVAPSGEVVSKRLRKFIFENGGSVAQFGKPGSFYNSVKLLSAQYDLDFIDVFPAFLKEGEQAYFPHDLHWSETGHKLMSRLLLEHMNRPRLY